MERINLRLFLIPIALGLILWFLPPPQGVTPQGWHLLSVFIATILACILGPAPMGVIALLALCVIALTRILPTNAIFAPFGAPVVWLIVSAFLLSRGFIKTGFGTRLAYIFISKFGHKTLGLSYALLLCETILAPAIPSNAARGAGVIYPVMKSITASYGSSPQEGTQKKMGSFLFLSGYNNNLVSSAFFMTGMAPTPLAMSLAATQGVHVTWGTWLIAAIVPIGILAVITPLIIYWIYPPQVKNTPDAPAMAKQKLAEIGPLTRNEKFLLVAFCLVVFLWAFGSYLKVNNTVAAIVGIGVLLLTDVLTFDDIKSEKAAWDVLIWLAPLLMMTEGLAKLGVITWFSTNVQQALGSLPWFWGLVALAAVYFYAHYFFTSNTSHVNAMYVPFLSVAIGLGAPPITSAIILAFMHCLFAVTTHFGTPTGPVYYGEGYVDKGAWWGVGFALSLVYLGVIFSAGMLWWQCIGLG